MAESTKKVVSLVDNVRFTDESGVIVEFEEKGGTFDLPVSHYDRLVDAEAVAPADGSKSSKAPASKPADKTSESTPAQPTHKELDAEAKKLKITFPKKSNVAAKIEIVPSVLRAKKYPRHAAGRADE